MQVVRTGVVITVKPKVVGRNTYWPVTCDEDDCAEGLLDIKPPTRERGTWLAMDHRRTKHGNHGSIRVLPQPKAKRGKRANR